MFRSLLIVLFLPLLFGCTLQLDLESLGLASKKDIVTVDVVSPVPEKNSESTIPVTVNFSESLKDIDTSFFAVVNGTISGFSGSGSTYTFNVIPSADGTVTISFPQTEVETTGGTTKKKTNTITLNFYVDRVVPTVALSTSASSPTNVAAIPVAVTFSESVTGLEVSDFVVSGGGAAVTSFSGSGSSYNLVVTASMAGTVNISLPSAKVKDLGGNGNTASNAISIIYDNTLAVPVLASTASSTTNLSVLPITVNFGGVDVTGLDLSDFTVVNGTASNLQTISGSSYTLDVTPTADGAVSVYLPANTVLNPLNAGNFASNTLALTVDRVPPTLAISAPTPTSAKSSTSLSFTVTYSGASSISLSAGDITLGGTATTAGCIPSVSGTGLTTRTVTVSGCSGDGTLNISVPANSAQDSAGNLALAQGPSANATIDNTAPSLAITGPSPSSGGVAAEFTWTLTYSGADLITLLSGDISLTGTSITGCAVSSVSVSGAVGTVKVTGCSADPGSVKINVAANTARDALGNQTVANTSASSATISNSIDPNDPAQANNLFIATWDTTKTSTGSSASNQIQLPLVAGQTYNFSVDWGDGSAVQTVTTSSASHTYVTPGVYEIKMLGAFPRLIFNSTGDRLKLLDVKQWGNNSWNFMQAMFKGCTNLVISATDAPNLSSVTNMSSMFMSATYFNSNINHWNTSNVTNMSYMFSNATAFNQPLNGWNTGNVTNMNNMFSSTRRFNQPLASWNTSKVTDMSYMFQSSPFNQPIGAWNTAAVTNMSYMFDQAYAFNQPIGSWNTGAVTNMNRMFGGARAFNQAIGSWNTASVTNMQEMFYQASAFNQSISGWSTGNVTTMIGMFSEATAFNQPIGTWNTGKVTNMSQMFSGASAFNQPIGGWDVTKVTRMTQMFLRARSFNQPLSTWNTSTVTYMNSMFDSATAFNQNLSAWTVAQVTSKSGFDTSTTAWKSTKPTGMGTAYVDPYPNPTLTGGEPADAFITMWRTDIAGASASNQIRLPLRITATYNFVVDWGDGTAPDTITAWNDAAATHTYATAGKYKVTMTGSFPIFAFNSGGDLNKILDVMQWGTNVWSSVDSMFRDCGNLNISAVDAPDLSMVSSMASMFRAAKAFNSNINHWDTSGITNMSYVFSEAYAFNQPLNNWNTASVTNMSSMFEMAYAFNGSVSGWNTGNVTTMNKMFSQALAFNQPVATWNITSVTDLSFMFNEARAFNQPIDAWNTANVTNLRALLTEASGFNQALASWNTSSVVNMSGLFSGARAFDQPLTGWTTASVTDMSGMFGGASAFNQSISSWNTAGVTNMSSMFSGAWNFNQSLSGWSTAAVTDMYRMFNQAYAFDSDLSSWVTTSVISKPPTDFATSTPNWLLPKPTW